MIDKLKYYEIKYTREAQKNKKMHWLANLWNVVNKTHSV